ncbi:hypothetical protein ACQEV2_41875 [Streptomyces sp. CA-251387]|uniref:hypothetical protein n=1 Tax=Streptomyces sp. CA-251387 TaxID=3240064 RepID=UPI003D8B1FFB
MAAFIIGPLAAAIIPVTIVAGTLLIAFDLATIYTLLLSIRDFERFIASPSVPTAPEPTALPTLWPHS